MYRLHGLRTHILAVDYCYVARTAGSYDPDAKKPNFIQTECSVPATYLCSKIPSKIELKKK